MFWWRKRNEGFEWRDYVRTTILVRREQRRQRLKDVQSAAAAHVKEAGKRGLDASVSGVRSASTGAWSHFKSLSVASASFLGRASLATGSALAATAKGLGAGTGTLARRAGEPLGPILEPLLSVVRAPKINLALRIAAALTVLGTAYRTWTFGFDGDALVAAVIASVLALLLVLAHLTDPGRDRRSGDREGLLAKLRNYEVVFPGDTRVSVTTAGLALLGIVSIAAAGSAALYYAAPSQIAGVVSAPSTTGALPNTDAVKLEGRAIAISGDTLRVAGTLITLDGIEAPETGQSCQRKSGKWRCGVAAKDALANLVRGRRISCELLSDGETGKKARCYTRGKDIARQLVREGSVFATGGFLSRYASVESEAQTDKVGLWAGDIERPQDYRDKRWEEATRSAPEGCPIKGRIRSGARTYLLPWQPSYDSVKLSTAKGERWFCSENEAKAAGWRRAAPS